MAPRESYVRGDDETGHRYRRILVDMIETALEPPETGNSSDMQRWAMRLQMRLLDHDRLQKELPVEKNVKWFEDFDDFRLDVQKVCRDGDTNLFLKKWPPDLAKLVEAASESGRPLGKMAKLPSPAFLALCEVASEVLSEAGQSTSVTRSSWSWTTPIQDVPTSERSITSHEKQYLQSVSSPGDVPAQLENDTRSDRRGLRRLPSRYTTNRTLQPSTFVEDEEPPRPPRGTKRSIGSRRSTGNKVFTLGDAAHSQSDELCKRADVLVAEAQSFDHQDMNRESMIEWRNRAYACLTEGDEALLSCSSPRTSGKESVQRLSTSLKHLGGIVNDLDEALDMSEPSVEFRTSMEAIESDAEGSDIGPLEDGDNRARRKRKKLEPYILLSSPSVSRSKSVPRSKRHLKPKAGLGFKPSESRAKPFKTELKRREAVPSTANVNVRLRERPVSATVDEEDEEPSLERLEDRQEGDLKHDPPCPNCESRGLTCFAPLGRLFGMRCRRCTRIKKHCAYSKIRISSHPPDVSGEVEAAGGGEQEERGMKWAENVGGSFGRQLRSSTSRQRKITKRKGSRYGTSTEPSASPAVMFNTEMPAPQQQQLSGPSTITLGPPNSFRQKTESPPPSMLHGSVTPYPPTTVYDERLTERLAMSEAPGVDASIPPPTTPFGLRDLTVSGERPQGDEEVKSEEDDNEDDHKRSNLSGSPSSHRSERAEGGTQHQTPEQGSPARRLSSASTLASSTSPDTPLLQLLDTNARDADGPDAPSRSLPHQPQRAREADAANVASAISTITEHMKAASAAEARDAWLLLQAHFGLKKET